MSTRNIVTAQVQGLFADQTAEATASQELIPILSYGMGVSPQPLCEIKCQTAVFGHPEARHFHERMKFEKNMFTPRLEVLPAPQQKLWHELAPTPSNFVLYGGTALALRLGHRTSEDFDFFSSQPFLPATLQKTIPYLWDSEISQSEANTLTVIVERNGPVKVSFFGGLRLNRVQDPDIAIDTRIRVASLLDLAATKMVTIQQRAQAKDYLDVLALAEAGVPLHAALAAAAAVYGPQFNGLLSLKALTYFGEGDLGTLSRGAQTKLREIANAVDLKQIPAMEPRGSISGEGKLNERS